LGVEKQMSSAFAATSDTDWLWGLPSILMSVAGLMSSPGGVVRTMSIAVARCRFLSAFIVVMGNGRAGDDDTLSRKLKPMGACGAMKRAPALGGVGHPLKRATGYLVV
jgi:hypothetical protein